MAYCPGYTIRFARSGERSRIMEFIGEHWRIGHVLSQSSTLFEWQFEDVSTGEPQFVLGEHSASGAIAGILGFISPAHFDSSLSRSDLWLSLWRVREDLSASGLGLFMLRHLELSLRPVTIAAIGISDQAARLYRALGYSIGNLSHLYLPNPRRLQFQLAENLPLRPPHTKYCKTYAVRQLAAGEEDRHINAAVSAKNGSADRPLKSASYYRKRFREHPFYDYRYYLIESSDGVPTVAITRVAEHEGACALRIVEVVGSQEACLSAAGGWEEILVSMDAEYVDYYRARVPPAVSHLAPQVNPGAFIHRSTCDAVTIPHYFEPFERRNVELQYAVKSSISAHYEICRGDADQDRPSIL